MNYILTKQLKAISWSLKQINRNSYRITWHAISTYSYSSCGLCVTRYPSYVYCIKMLYGNVAEVLVEEILHHGQMLHEHLIPKAITKVTRNVKGSLHLEL